MPVFLNSLALRNYRGIGDQWAEMPVFKEFNFFIGPNNAGKSTVLNFISKHLPVPQLGPQDQMPGLDPLEIHHGATRAPSVKFGFQVNDIANVVMTRVREQHMFSRVSLDRILEFISDENRMVWAEIGLPYVGKPQLAVDKNVTNYSHLMHQHEWQSLWASLTGQRNGGLIQHWIPEILNIVEGAVDVSLPRTRLIPAIRQIGPSGVRSEDYSGAGLIDSLMELQSPDVDRRADREKFNQINAFLQDVTDSDNAVIEIPHNRAHVLVDIDGRVLPLANLGTGIHEVVMIAAFCTLSSNEIVCIEEPEIHLHPLLQRKLISYLRRKTSNQYFIATHSASFIDTPNSAIFHVRSEGGSTQIREALLNQQRHAICVDLGYRASDIVQSNAVIWVEGPSDRIYLKYWLAAIRPDLLEGVHYSIMFYGGRLLSHLSANDDEVSDFISLRALNRHVAIMIDSDKKNAHDTINSTKARIEAEFSRFGGVAWITKGREVENYVDHAVLQNAVAAVSPSYASPLKGGMYEHALHYKRTDPKKVRTKPLPKDLNETEVDKVKVSRVVAAEHKANLDILDLRERLTEIVGMIDKANA